jgi:TRAP transporter 4TM/12TM fusion protein
MEKADISMNLETSTTNNTAAGIEVDEILSRIDKASSEEIVANGFYSDKAILKILFGFVSIGLLIYTFYSGAIVPIPAFVQRALHLIFIVVLCMQIYPSKIKLQNKIHIGLNRSINLVLTIIGIFSISYFAFQWKALYTAKLTFIDTIFAVIIIFLVLEVTRRALGMALVLIVAAGVLYAVLGPYLPNAIAHRGYTLQRILSQISVGTEGLFGSVLGISSTYVAAFVFFASFLESFGGLQVFMRLALSISGSLKGGAAKISIIASGFFSMISGSTVANVVSTGSITIPLMKRMGYPKAWAGGTEAAASTGGTFTPPIMGATAFILAEFISQPYTEVMKAAIIPAFLYFVGLYSAVHAQSCRQGFTGLPRHKLPSFLSAFSYAAPLLVPVAVMVTLLFQRYTAMSAAMWSCLLLFIMASFSKLTRPTISRIVHAAKAGAKAMVVVSSACAAAGIFIAILNLTGLGFKLSSVIVSLSGGNLLIALLLTQATAVVLGTGLVTPAVYALLGVLVAPGLIKLGVAPMPAHMFILFVSALAPITPPVALAAYAASGIAGDSPFKVGKEAVKLALPAFFLPYFFVYSPSLLGMGDWQTIAVHFLTALVGVYFLGIGTQGYFRRILKWPVQSILVIASLLLIVPNTMATMVGICLLLSTLIGLFMTEKNKDK